MEPVRPTELIAAARVADGLVYVTGVAGVVAGAQLFRTGDVPMAVVVWVLTFVAGAVLRLVVWMARGIASVMDRNERIEQQLARLREQEVDDARPDPMHPPRRWGGWH